MLQREVKSMPDIIIVAIAFCCGYVVMALCLFVTAAGVIYQSICGVKR